VGDERHFSIEEEKVGSVAVVNVAGDVDLLTVPEFSDRLWHVIDRGEKRILIDCDGTRFIDSKMIEALMKAAGFLRRTGGAQLAITSGPPHIGRIFTLCGVDRVAVVRGSRAAALRELDSN
jgi:anti-anti-sigma factor